MISCLIRLFFAWTWSLVFGRDKAADEKNSRNDKDDKNTIGDYNTCKEPAWLVNRRKNSTESPLFQLPYDVLELILKAADSDTKWMLRQTCFYFQDIKGIEAHISTSTTLYHTSTDAKPGQFTRYQPYGYWRTKMMQA